ncbi:MAG: AMP-binding protein [Streptosporangiales bacterium]|nr:AMP-binding protein [Streptosporangiales bacterium]
MYPGAIAQTSPDRPAVIMAGSGRTITYRELDEESNRLAHLFRAEGLRPGDHVAFMLENHPLYLTVAWAAQRSGLRYTAISSRLQTDELAYILNDCEARLFITSAALAEVAGAVTESTPGVRTRLMLDGTAPGFDPYEKAVAAHPPTPIPDECEGGDMLYSSGTTGRPKGIVPRGEDEGPQPIGTENSLLMLVKALFGADGESVYLSPAPMYHAAPLRYCVQFQRLGATIVVMEKFDPEGMLRAIERYGVTHTQVVPTHFVRLQKLPEEVRARYDISSLKAVVHAAAPCPVEVKERMFDWWGPIIHEYYAGTEGNGFVYAGPQDWLAHKGTVGRALLGTVRICDEEGAEVPPGDHGTVYFEGGNAFEYHNDPEKTAAAQDPQGRGWTTLGDVGYLDQEGFLYLTDRRSYMIISGGVNIYPQEAENVLVMHPRVADVAVLGVPDPEMGEAVKAVVAPAEGVVPGPELERELIAYCRSKIAHYKCPRSVDFRDELPRHPTGKLYKRLLKDEYWKAAGAS